MRWSSLLWVLVGFWAISVPAGVVESALARSREFQRSGQPAEALRCLQEARVEVPEATALLFGMAGAEVALGDKLLEAHDIDGAVGRYLAARETFERCSSAARLAESAAFNGATCLLRVERALERKSDYPGRLENLRLAVEALSDVVAKYPDHAPTRKNLDHARYRLALLLQEPPPDPEKDQEEPPDDEGQTVSEVVGATTQIPNATAEVEDGAIVVLRIPPRGEAAP